MRPEKMVLNRTGDSLVLKVAQGDAYSNSGENE